MTFGYGYNPAGQIRSRTSTNDAYAWTGAANVSRNYAADGLNRYAAIDGIPPPTYDGRGNLTKAGSVVYGYNASNQLAAANGNWFYHDAVGRLDVDAGGCQFFDYAGSRMTGELDCNGAGTLRRYVYGADEAPVLWYEGAGLADKRYLHTDERGSVIALSDAGGVPVRINAYDEYGIPHPWNLGRFQYTGQMWLPTLQMYSYKARIYSPTLGRFMQTDPIGYGDGMNWYNYVGGDPVNFTDPSGTHTPDTHCFDEDCSADFGVSPDQFNADDAWARRDLANKQDQYLLGRWWDALQRQMRGIQSQNNQPSSGPVIGLGSSLEGYLGPMGGGAGGGAFYDLGNGLAGVYGSTESAYPQNPGTNGLGSGLGLTLGAISFTIARNMSTFSGNYETKSLGIEAFSITYSHAVGHLFSFSSITVSIGGNFGPLGPVAGHSSYGNTTAIGLFKFRFRW